MTECSSVQFAVFRIALGAFLAAHFLQLAPYAAEIYGPHGMYPVQFPTPFPNAIGMLGSDERVRASVWGLASLAGLFMVGFQRRLVALVLWYGWACLTDRVPFLYIPSEGLVGWLLLLAVITPHGEAWSVSPRARQEWHPLPGTIYVVWIVLGVGYLASGVDKLGAPSWIHGTAMRSVLTSPISRWDAVADFARDLPDVVVRSLSWAVVGFESLFLSLIWHRRTRALAWAAATVFHLVIRATLNLHTVTDPFLVTQILLFDVSWIRTLRVRIHNALAA